MSDILALEVFCIRVINGPSRDLYVVRHAVYLTLTHIRQTVIKQFVKSVAMTVLVAKDKCIFCQLASSLSLKIIFGTYSLGITTKNI